MHPVRRLAPLAAILAFSVAAFPAQAWDVTPWDPAPFWQPQYKPAEARARIAATRAGVQARNANVLQGSAQQRNVTQVGSQGSSCLGAVGSVIAPQNLRSGRLTAITNVRVDTVNVFC